MFAFLGVEGEPRTGGYGAICGHRWCFDSIDVVPCFDFPAVFEVVVLGGVWTHCMGDSAWWWVDGTSDHAGCVDY